MGERFSSICDKIIEYSFYALFLVVPLTFTSYTYELFEFNKMWLTFGLTIVIVAVWIVKMILQRKILIQRTPLDLPILLFLLSQIISTIYSLDTHVSLWGYYSRFNGGLLSIISYILLYYAFVSNFSTVRGDASEGPPQRTPRSSEARLAEHWGDERVAGPRAIKRFLLITLTSGALVALWGLPSHFGYDPTCLLLRGSLDVSCWTDAFQPKIRIFSTLGQPNWLAAYLAILIPIAIAFIFQNTQKTQYARISEKSDSLKIRNTDFLTLRVFRVFWKEIILIALNTLLYLDLLFTGSQSGFLGLWVGLAFFAAFYVTRKHILLVTCYLLLVTFLVGSPISALNKFTFPHLKNQFLTTKPASLPSPQTFAGELGGTDSSKIRLIVWRGALEIAKHNPLFGTGVETFAFAYYKYRPAEHNLTSEWDYLYNKAHNEYLNFLATTGIVGLGTYLLMIGWFFFHVIPNLFRDLTRDGNEMLKRVQHDNGENKILILALLASYITILVSNFFGFSTVVINIYFFLIPAFVFILSGQLNTRSNLVKTKEPTPVQLVATSLALLISFLLLSSLLRFWKADTSYASGYNYNRAAEYNLAYPELYNAVIERPDEPVFQDELAYNSAVLAVAFNSEKDATSAATFASQAQQTSDVVISEHPYNIVFWKTRVRIFYALTQIDPKYTKDSISALEEAIKLAPTDAKTLYNLGLVYGQNDNLEKSVAILQKTIELKPNYTEARYALALFYRELATDKKGNVVKPEFQAKAVEHMKYILEHLSPKDEQATEALKSWGESY